MSPHFPLGPLAGEFYDNGRKLVLLRSFAFDDIADCGAYIVIPALTTSDFNSTPRALWSFFPPWHYPEAGVVHDYLYRNGGRAVAGSQSDTACASCGRPKADHNTDGLGECYHVTSPGHAIPTSAYVCPCCPYRSAPYTRAEADAIHRRILELTGASWFLRWASHRALRLFGGGAWRAA